MHFSRDQCASRAPVIDINADANGITLSRYMLFEIVYGRCLVGVRNRGACDVRRTRKLFQRKNKLLHFGERLQGETFDLIPHCLPPVCDSVSVSGASASPGVFAAAGHSAFSGAGGGRALFRSPLPPASTGLLTV